MSYKLNYMISLIESNVVLMFPDGSSREYADGKQAAEETFDKRYDVKSMKANVDKVEVVLTENDGTPIDLVADGTNGFY